MIKRIINRALCMIAAFSLVSCSQDVVDDSMAAMDNDPNADTFRVQLNVPDEMVTRAAASVSKGDDGLFTFSRNVNKLWYAIYSNKTLLYSSADASSPQPVYRNGGFSLEFKLTKPYSASKITLFFWAGNADDNVVFTTDKTFDENPGDGIHINAGEFNVAINPNFLNGKSSIDQYDSFSGYFQLAESDDAVETNRTFTLTRPFAQIHLLSSEFCAETMKKYYPDGIAVCPGFDSSETAITSSNINARIKNPYVWFYDSFAVGRKVYNKDSYAFTNTNRYQFTNDLSDEWPMKTTFKGKDYCYLGCYLVFAPKESGSRPTDADGKEYGYLNIAIRDRYATFVSSDVKTVKFPSKGIIANNRYVVYNGNNPSSNYISDAYTIEVSPSGAISTQQVEN